MNPQQPFNSPNVDYSFILQNQPKKNNPFKGPGSTKKRLINVLIVAGILIILVVIIFSIISSSGNSSKKSLYELATFQIKLKDLADYGAANTGSTLIKNTSTVAVFSFETDLQQTLAAINKQGEKTTVKKITAEYGSTFANDLKQLENAKKVGNFDSAYKTLFDAKLIEYQKQLKTNYATQKSKSFKTALNASNGNAILVSFSNKENSN